MELRAKDFEIKFKDLFPGRFEKLLKKERITAKELSRKIGISEGILSGYRNGEHIPSVAKLVTIAAYFKVPCDYLTGESISMLRSNYDVAKKMGFSDKAIKNAELFNKNYTHILSDIIENDGFHRIIRGIIRIKFEMIFYNNYIKKTAGIIDETGYDKIKDTINRLVKVDFSILDLSNMFEQDDGYKKINSKKHIEVLKYGLVQDFENLLQEVIDFKEFDKDFFSKLLELININGDEKLYELKTDLLKKARDGEAQKMFNAMINW